LKRLNFEAIILIISFSLIAIVGALYRKKIVDSFSKNMLEKIFKKS